MRAAANLLGDRVDSISIAHMMTLEQGKPPREARGEILAATDIIDWFADVGLRVHGRPRPHGLPPTIRRRTAPGW